MKNLLKQTILFTSFFILSSAFCFLSASPVRAEVIRGYDAQITIQKDGRIQVSEKIDYDFGYLYKHGIYRDIPYIKKNSDGKEYELGLQVLGVKDEEGNAYHYTQSWVNNKLQIKIGDADRTITGLHTYRIDYEVSGALTYFSDHDELYWNITGVDWEVNQENVNGTVHLPEGTDIKAVKTLCFVGAQGSTSTDCQTVTENNSTSVSISSLEAGRGLTIVVSFPTGLVARLEPKPYVAFESTWYGKIILGIIFALLGIGAFIWYICLPIYIPVKWWLKGRDPRSQDVRVWYDPPKTSKGRELTAAETGTLVDETADTKDIFGSIIQLAEKGYLSIKEEKKGEFTFVEGRVPGTELLPFEKKIISALFQGGNEVKVKDLQLSTEFQDISKKLYTQVVEDGFFPESPEAIRTKYYILAGVALFTGNLFLAMVAFLFGRNMPRKTELGAQAASIGRSLKTFLSSQERQLKFAVEKNQALFEKLLPYAIVFGVEKIWADRFKDMALTNPSWYTGYNNNTFNAVYFANTMHRSVGTFTTAMTPTRSSSGFSSGFGGGGFSGGGGGGGGGGSW
jgi:hypothetical protein